MKLATWWQRRAVRITVYVALAVGTYLAALGWGLPALIERQAPKWVAQEMAAELSLEQVRFHPLEWRVTIDKLALTGDDGKPLAGLEQLVVDLEPWRSLFSRHWQLQAVSLTAPYLDYRQRGPEENNWHQALAPLLAKAESAPPEPEPEPSGLPKLAIDQFVLEQGRIRYEQDQRHTTELTDLALEAENFHLARGENKLALRLSGPGGGQANITLDANFDPLDLAMTLDLKNADLTRYWPYLAEDFHFDLANAQTDINLSAHLSLDPELQLRIEQGELTLRDLDMVYQETSLVRMQQAVLAPVEFDLAAQQVSLGELSVEGLAVNAQLSDKGLDLATLLTPIGAEEAESGSETPSEAASPWQVQLQRLTLADATLSLTDQTAETPVDWQFDVAPLVVGPLGTDTAQPLTIDLDTHINQYALLTLDGEWQLDNNQGEFEVALNDFDLTDTIPYWQSLLNLKLHSGQLTTRGDVTVALDDPLSVTFQGEIGVANLVTQDALAERDFVKWGQMDINHLDFDLAQRFLKIDQLAFNEPYARIIIDEDGSTNFAGLVASVEEDQQGGNEAAQPAPAQTAPAQPQTGEAPFDVTVGRILFANGSAFFADNTLTPKFATGIETLTGEISGLDAQQESRAVVDIQGQVDRYAPVSLKGTVQPLAEKPFMDLALNFDNIELTSLNPYSGTYAGYFIDQGQLDLALKYALDDNQLQGSNQVVISQLKLGQRSDSDKATSLPVALAVALLQDSNGVIDLGLQVSGNVDDPEFAIGPLIFKALGNVITKIVTSPFALLGNLLGGEDPPDHVQFAAGQSQMDPEQTAQMARLVEALSQRPSLVLSAQGAVDPVADGRALAKVALDARLMPQGSGLTEPPELALAAAYDAVMGMGKAQSEQQMLAERLPDLDDEERNRRWRKGLYEQLLEAQPADEAALKNLASARGEAVKAALVEAGLAAERVFLRESRINLDQSGAKVVLELDAAG
ncbi:DUF748 domain-containing protein [Ferrimonas balearica]|uniref:DUF748 domain-containing protein n=1 Tax=Ferrimonas balearica TaxID=44012 RepID=UPI001C93B6CA|nr:DUF748 domain-containing protein [Ferrimonas balearica]